MSTALIDVAAVARLLKLSTRRVRVLCAEGRIAGAQLIAGSWIIVAKVDGKGKIKVEVAPPHGE